ncbi:LSm family protein [Acetivibrio cellulolyticus]|uniref:hypothetical protein n=1 Tax=Acetivibrio cellulolyticus TaxID=35830 RepID=UPI0001E2D882|nr:hypothetical protein [Acetivibrio cellulolyticus]
MLYPSYEIQKIIRNNARYFRPVFSQSFMSFFRIDWNPYIGQILIIFTADGNVYEGQLASVNTVENTLVLSEIENGGQITIKISDITECYLVIFKQLVP